MASTFPSGGSLRSLRFVERREPGKLPAAVLALVVHAAFFAVVVFGVSWQVKHPAPLVAELWDQLPPLRAETPVPSPAPEPAPPPPPPEPEVKKAAPVKPVVEQPSKAEIQLKAKKEKAEREKADREKAERLKKDEEEKKRKIEEAHKRAAKAAEEKARAEQAAREAAANAARNAALQDYAGKISALIKSRANIPDTVSGKPETTIRLRLLVNGVVFDAKVIKSSGNRVYDEAVERAINGIRQWPLPDNPELLGSSRELNLNLIHER